MYYKVVFTIFFLVGLCCDVLRSDDLFYRNGDTLDVEITYLSPSKAIRSLEFNGQVCNSSTLLPLVAIHLTSDDEFWKVITFNDEIHKNQQICSYYTTVLATNRQRQIQLFHRYDGYIRNSQYRAVAADHPYPRLLHYKITVDLKRYSYNIIASDDITGKVPKPDAAVIEGEIGSDIEYICTPENVNQSSSIHLISKHPVITAALAEKTGEPKHLTLNLQEFDNNTYISCASRPSADKFENTKWTLIKVKPRAEDSKNNRKYTKEYKYPENEIYDFECTHSPARTLYIMRLSESDEIITSSSSNEFTWKLSRQVKLTKNYHNTKLVCMTFDCEYNTTHKYHQCSRRELNSVKFVMKNDSGVDKVPSDKCQLPAQPRNGTYQVLYTPDAVPFQISDFWVIKITCDHGFGIRNGQDMLHCTSGVWSPTNKLPECVPFCKLNRHPSVTYNCRTRDTEALYTRSCDEYEPPGMLAIAECKTPEYTSNDELPIMYCNAEGKWSISPTCMPACGEFTPGGKVLINGGEYSKLGELPWHVAVYEKTSKPYEQVCGGTIVRPSVVISAAHCFWKDSLPDDQKLRPASEYAIAAGKVYRAWDHPTDNQYAQKADVILINVPNRYHGRTNSFVDDLAVVVLAKSFVYKPHIAPICLNFNEHFDSTQIAKGIIGKVTGWGVDSPGGQSSPRLKVVDLPIVPYLECYNTSPVSFRRYITEDKICAGYKDQGTAVCTGDSGGGLVVAGDDRGVTRYYLRGVVSAGPDELVSCTANELTTFTHVMKHYGFIKTYLLL